MTNKIHALELLQEHRRRHWSRRSLQHTKGGLRLVLVPQLGEAIEISWAIPDVGHVVCNAIILCI